jgi:hypothetical protein
MGGGGVQVMLFPREKQILSISCIVEPLGEKREKARS